MKIPIPSFRIQIFFIVLFLVINSVLFFRNYFLESFQSYSNTTDSLRVGDKLTQVYNRYYDSIREEDQSAFKKEIEELLITQQQAKLAKEYFRDEMSLSSKFIFVFLTLSVLLLFLFSFNLITTPLKRLQMATEKLRKGDLDVEISESRFSPLNHLIKSFNSMASELKESREKLIEAEKESAWRGMARIMAHEIKNPLTPIKLSLERMETKFYTASTQFDRVFKKTTAVIHEEINNLHSLAKEFSEFARLPQANIENIQLNSHLNEILEPYLDSCKFSVNFTSTDPEIMADRNHFKQVVVNIIQNAIHASNSENKIEIQTEMTDSETVAIRIKDHGSGIPKENLDHIFEPYYTQKEKGTGLGLAIVKRIVEQHDGKIIVESEIGIGTTFSLFFKVINPHPKGI